MKYRSARLIAGLALVATACDPWAAKLRWGNLREEARQVRFTHDIELFAVSNGLTVAQVDDPRTNLATVDVRYQVGASADPPGRAGMAHLVEHLMFELREHAGGPTLGNELDGFALSWNANTSWDATHYTAVVPADKLPEALALEARRMQGRCADLDDTTFARERDVVLAEGAQRGIATAPWNPLYAFAFGPTHAYARMLTSNEVARVTKDEVCQFITDHYGPDRAILVVTGRVPSDFRDRVAATFGRLRSTALAPRPAEAAPAMHGETARLTAAVPRSQAIVFLPYPRWGDATQPAYDLAASRLQIRLDEQVARREWARGAWIELVGDHWSRALAVGVEVGDADHLQAAADLVFAQAKDLFAGLDQDDVRRAGRQLQVRYAAPWDDLDGRGAWLADYLQYTDHHRFMLADLQTAGGLDRAKVAAEIAGAWTRDHARVALVTAATGQATTNLARAVPTGTHQGAPWRWPVDPALADQPVEVTAPSLADRVTTYALPNGLTVELAPDARSPMFEARLVFPVGRGHDPVGRPGLADAAAQLLDLDEALAYHERQASRVMWVYGLGGIESVDVGETSTAFRIRGLSTYGDWHLWRLANLLEHGSYNPTAIDAARRAARVGLRGGKDAPGAPGASSTTDDKHLRAFLARLFGADHPYAQPRRDVGRTMLAIGASDLEQFRRARYRASGATLIVSGDFDVAAMREEIATQFGPWTGAAPTAPPAIPAIAPARGPSWLAADDARAVQVALRLGFAVPSAAAHDAAARAVLQEMLEDALRDVREGMGASYGIHATYADFAAGGVLLVTGTVDEGLAAEATRRVLAAVTRLREHAADDKAGFVRARRKALASAQAQLGGAAAVATRLEDLAAEGEALDRDRAVARAIGALTPEAIGALAASELATEHMVVQLAGKRAAVDAVFAALGQTPERPR